MASLAQGNALRKSAFWSKILFNDFAISQPGNHFCPYRTWLDMLHHIRRVLPWAMETIGLSARPYLYVLRWKIAIVNRFLDRLGP